jgi:hypothetical protein
MTASARLFRTFVVDDMRVIAAAGGTESAVCRTPRRIVVDAMCANDLPRDYHPDEDA